MNSQSANRILLLVWLLLTAGLLVYLTVGTVDADRSVARRTLLLGMFASLFAIPVGGLLAWVSLSRGTVGRLTLTATICLLVIPVFLHVSTWDAAFGKLGWLSSEEGKVLTPLVSGWTAAIWIHAVAAAPQVAMILMLGITIGQRVFEEQALLETSRFGVFWNVTVKRLWPLVVVSVLWTVIVCAREIAATDLYQIGTLAEQIYLGYSLGQFTAMGGNWTTEQLAAMGELNITLTIAIVGWLSVTAACLFIRLSNLEWESNAQRPLTTQIPSLARKLTGVLLLAILIAIPLANLVIRCCYYVKPVDGVPTPGYSFQQLVDTLGRACRDYTSEFTWSFLIAGASATLILVLAMIISWRARRSWAWQFFFIATLAISCALPGPLIGSLIAKLFTAVDMPTIQWLYNRTIIAPVLANACFCWPLGPLVVWFVFRKIALDALENSQLEGAGGLSQFFRFGLLANLPAIAGCWLLSFAFCFGELSASQTVLPPGIDTVPRLMLGLLHAGVNEMTAALTIVTVGGILVVSLFGWWLIRLNGRGLKRK